MTATPVTAPAITARWWSQKRWAAAEQMLELAKAATGGWL